MPFSTYNFFLLFYTLSLQLCLCLGGIITDQVDNAMVPLVRIGKGDRSLPVLSLSFKFQLVWLLMFCFRLHNSSKSINSGFTTFHHRDFTRYNFWKKNQLTKGGKTQ